MIPWIDTGSTEGTVIDSGRPEKPPGKDDIKILEEMKFTGKENLRRREPGVQSAAGSWGRLSAPLAT